jgi:hypothetical protein
VRRSHAGRPRRPWWPICERPPAAIRPIDALKDKGVPVPDIAKKLTIKTGKYAGKSPSAASLYRALAEAEQAAADDGLPIRPKPVRIRHPDDPLTPEEADLRERLQAQVLQRPEDE